MFNFPSENLNILNPEVLRICQEGDHLATFYTRRQAGYYIKYAERFINGRCGVEFFKNYYGIPCYLIMFKSEFDPILDEDLIDLDFDLED